LAKKTTNWIEIEADKAQFRSWLSRNRQTATLEIRLDGHRVRLRGAIAQWATLQRLVSTQLELLLDALPATKRRQ
jgi:hypothetical protein